MGEDLVPFRRPALPPAPTRDTQIDDRVWELIRSARSPRTQEAYRTQWTKFRLWCETTGRQAEPATVETVLSYVAHLTHQRGRDGGPVSPSTVELAVTAIRTVHKAVRDVLRLRDPRSVDWPVPESGLITSAVVGYRKRLEEQGWQPYEVTGLRSEDVRAMLRVAERDRAKGARNAAMLLLHLDMFARGAEIARLRVDHVIDRGDHLDVRLVGAKTGTREVPVEPNPFDVEMCPVAAWRTWRDLLLANGGHARGPAFVRMRRKDVFSPPLEGIDQRHVTDVIKLLATKAGLQGTFSAHSLRHGPVGEVLEHPEVDSLDAKQRGGWRSDSSFGVYAKRARSRVMNPWKKVRRPDADTNPVS